MEPFQDRRVGLFGRENDVYRLTKRAQRQGLTAVVGRPLMGKTWTLNEVARRLTAEGEYLVGYHESKAAESSHMLYAVSNLYARWLTDSTMRDQAISLWERHKKDLVPGIGKMVGMLFDKLAGKQFPEGVAAIVRACFDSLAEAQKDLLSGGVQLPTLSYDQALSLTNLVAKLSDRYVVLILDAWEKSPSIRSEFAMLETFLKHQNDWPHTHIFLAIRNPELDSTKLNNEAHQRAKDLCKIDPSAIMYDFLPMDLTSLQERARIIRFLCSEVHAARQVNEQDLLQMIDSFPGVLSFWTNAANRSEMQTVKDLIKVANNAQSLRYLEFDHLLKGLPENQHILAARLAFFPRFDEKYWLIFRQILLKDIPDAVVNELIDANVLNDESFPTYGHDTRHAAARRWFIENQRPLIRRVSESLVESLASHITGLDSINRPMFEVLAACFEASQQVGANQTISCLIAAARTIFGDFDGIFHKTFDDEYPRALRQNASFVFIIGIALQIRGDIKGERGDIEEAIADYTDVIALPNTSADQVTMALYNRGLYKKERGDIEGAIADFTAVIALPNASPDRIAMALFNRGATKGERGDFEEAIADFTAVIALPNAPAEQVANVLINRGVAKRMRGDFEEAIADFAAVIALPNTLAEQAANALIHRGVAKRMRGNFEEAIADFTAVIALPNTPPELVASALINRGFYKREHGDIEEAIADFTAVIVLPNASAEDVATALYNRGVIKRERGDIEGATADYTDVISLPSAPTEKVVDALYSRGVIKRERGGSEEAITDFTAVIVLPNVPPDRMAMALLNRGGIKGERGDIEETIADFTAVIALPNAPAEQVAKALYNRGLYKRKRGDIEEALADYTSVIALPNAPAEQVADALVNCGFIKSERGDIEEALADYTSVIALPNAPVELVAGALINRGIIKGTRGDIEEAIADFTAVIVLPNASAEDVATAHYNRSVAKGNYDRGNQS